MKISFREIANIYCARGASLEMGGEWKKPKTLGQEIMMEQFVTPIKDLEPKGLATISSKLLSSEFINEEPKEGLLTLRPFGRARYLMREMNHKTTSPKNNSQPLGKDIPPKKLTTSGGIETFMVRLSYLAMVVQFLVLGLTVHAHLKPVNIVIAFGWFLASVFNCVVVRWIHSILEQRNGL